MKHDKTRLMNLIEQDFDAFQTRPQPVLKGPGPEDRV